MEEERWYVKCVFCGKIFPEELRCLDCDSELGPVGKSFGVCPLCCKHFEYPNKKLIHAMGVT